MINGLRFFSSPASQEARSFSCSLQSVQYGSDERLKVLLTTCFSRGEIFFLVLFSQFSGDESLKVPFTTCIMRGEIFFLVLLSQFSGYKWFKVLLIICFMRGEIFFLFSSVSSVVMKG